jgi:hypothetical protein
MKIRLDRQSLRVRLSKDEVVRFAREKFLTERIPLTLDRALSVALELREEAGLEFANDQIRVFIAPASEKMVEALRGGIFFKAAPGVPLEIIIEEDLHS